MHSYCAKERIDKEQQFIEENKIKIKEAEDQIIFCRSAVAAGAVHGVPKIFPNGAAPLLMQTAADGPELFCGVPS